MSLNVNCVSIVSFLSEMATEIDFKDFLKVGHSRPLFFIFVYSVIQLVHKILPMTGFELRISGVESDRSTN